MLLSPSNTNFNNSHNNSSYNSIGHNLNLNHNLTYGQFGLNNENPNFLLFNNYLFNINIFLNNTVRRSNITNRYLWVNAFPHIPITNNVIGSRMGNGNGNPSNWAANIPSGSIFIEFSNVSPGSASHFMSQVVHKLPGSFKIVSSYNTYVPLISFNNTTIQYDYFY